MNTIKKRLLLSFCAIAANNLTAKTVDYIEDGYLLPASHELIQRTEKSATFFGFEQPYEVATPKKAAIQINPWNKFISLSTNPQTKNPALIINDQWFNTLSSDEQTFLLGHNFLRLKHGGLLPWSVKIISYLFTVLSLVLFFLLFWALGKIKRFENKAICIATAFVISVACELAFLNALQIKITNHVARKHDTHIMQMTIDKTQNKEAAIAALEAMDAGIKNELQNDEQFWAPHATLFEHYAKELKKR